MTIASVQQLANRSLQQIGARLISALTEDSKSASNFNAAYDLIRGAELRRAVWRFSVRRVVLRPFDAVSQVLTPPNWSAITTYTVGDIVSKDNVLWISIASANLNHVPDGSGSFWDGYYGPTHATPWSSTTTYFAGEIVYSGSPPSLGYLSIVNNNTAALSDTASWHPMNGVPPVTPIPVFSPIGLTSSLGARSVYRLPFGFVRLASNDPKQPAVSVLATSGAVRNVDWSLEDNYLISSQAAPFYLRFAADVIVIARMDPIFCEALAARVGAELCETLTQSKDKEAVVLQKYERYIGEARRVNAIELGSTEPDEMAGVAQAAQPAQQGAR